jgi:hypothetical protein
VRTSDETVKSKDMAKSLPSGRTSDSIQREEKEEEVPSPNLNLKLMQEATQGPSSSNQGGSSSNKRDRKVYQKAYYEK